MSGECYFCGEHALDCQCDEIGYNMKKEMRNDLIDICVKYREKGNLQDFCKYIIEILIMVILKKNSEEKTQDFVLQCLSHTIECRRQILDEEIEQAKRELGPFYDAATIVLRIEEIEKPT